MFKYLKKNISYSINLFEKYLIRYINSPNNSWLERTEPFSRKFGLDRGKAIDRKFIDQFLSYNKNLIQGDVLEVGDDRYIRKYGSNLRRQIVLAGKGIDNNTDSLDGDLTKHEDLKKIGLFDCVIATNVLNFIYDIDLAVKGLATLINPQTGTILATVAGSGPISRYDYDRWGDYWRFTDLSLKILFEKYFYSVEVEHFGNAPLAAAFIMGLSQEDIDSKLYINNDSDYQLIITVKASFPKILL